MVQGFSGMKTESGPRRNSRTGTARTWLRLVNQVELPTSSKAFTLTASRRVCTPSTRAAPRILSGTSKACEMGSTRPSRN